MSRSFRSLVRVPRQHEAEFAPPEIAWVQVGPRLDISFQLAAEVARNTVGLVDSPALGARRDELWKTTCFEVFTASEWRDGYEEINISPSGNWASYVFDDYRKGMRDSGSRVERFERRDDVWRAGIEFAEGADFIATFAILEMRDGTKSYWSETSGPVDRLDFHADFVDAWQGWLESRNGP